MEAVQSTLFLTGGGVNSRKNDFVANLLEDVYTAQHLGTGGRFQTKIQNVEHLITAVFDVRGGRFGKFS